jgi:TPR repeat protein
MNKDRRGLTMSQRFEQNTARRVRLVVSLLLILSSPAGVSAFPFQSDIEERVRALTPPDVYALVQKAQSGSAEAQYMLGRAYYLGYGVARDLIETVKWYKKAAEQNYALAESGLSHLYLDGEGVAKDVTEAGRWLQKAAEHGHAVSQFTLALVLEQQGKFAEAAVWHRKAAEQDLANAQNALGFYYDQGKGVSQDYKQAARWYRKAADNGDANAQSNLGTLYTQGNGVDRDYKEAARLFRLSADQGWAAGQANLAGLYITGQGVPRDLVSAYMWCSLAASTVPECKNGLAAIAAQMKPEEIEQAKRRTEDWSRTHRQMREARSGVYIKAPEKADDPAKEYRAAAESGDPKAQSLLGEVYYRAGNYGEALKWLRKSAEQGYSFGQYNLGVMYLEGSGVAKNESESVKWFTRAAEQWNRGAINNLVAAYFYGKGAEKNLVSAYMWLRIGAVAGDVNSAKNLDGLKAMLTPEQIADGERRAEQWQAEHKKPQ